MNTLFKYLPDVIFLIVISLIISVEISLYNSNQRVERLSQEIALRESMKKAYLSPLTGTSAKIPLTGSVLVNESKPLLRDQRRYLTGSTVTESRPNAKPNSVVDTEGEPNE